MSIRILINGSKGRMGQAAVKAISLDKELELVAETGRGDDLGSAIRHNKPDVVLDFTNAEAVFETTRTIIENKARPVIGTSGLLPEQIKQFQVECEKLQLGGIIAPNFSLGAVLMMKYAREAAKYFPHAEIIEMHHDGKLDSPSGTAMRTAEMMAEVREKLPIKPIRENILGARGANHQGIPIHAVRLPGLVAHQQVIFGDAGETLTIRHDSIDRISFMPGICLACKKVISLNTLVYGLEHVL